MLFLSFFFHFVIQFFFNRITSSLSAVGNKFLHFSKNSIGRSTLTWLFRKAGLFSNITITLYFLAVTFSTGLVCFYTSMFGTQEYVFCCVPHSVISRTSTQNVLRTANDGTEFRTLKII